VGCFSSSAEMFCPVGINMEIKSNGTRLAFLILHLNNIYEILVVQFYQERSKGKLGSGLESGKMSSFKTPSCGIKLQLN
jgi:hypothetical protein